ncbi:MAG TPA: response regulator transcription factor [Streptosporangiaceae bacterium]
MEPLVLLAEHEPEVAELARRYLARAGLRVRVTSSPDETTAALGERSVTVAVLDLTMPGLDARRVRRLLASPPVALPAVFLIGHTMRARDLRVSADACLPRPFSPRTLVARVRSAVPPAAPAARAGPAQRAAGKLTLTAAGHRVSSGGREVTLTPTEFALVAALAGNAGRVMSRGQLLAALGRDASGRAVDTYVAQVRAKLPRPGTIRTVRGVGYVLDV